ncbi:MAG: ATP-binding protein [Hyphomicrobium sp.]
MSIRLRLNLALGLLVASAFAAMIAALLLDSGPRLRSEIESSMAVTQSMVRSSIVPLQDSPAPGESLERFVESLKKLRHVRVELASKLQTDAPRAIGGTPAPFQSLTAGVQVHVAGELIDTIVITPEGSDEMNEVWETIERISMYGAAFSIIAFLVTSLLINRSLSPLSDLKSALRHLEDGDYSVTLAARGAPEISEISTRVNTLAAALNKSRKENRRLSSGIVRAQDIERREIARELHDELGPYLFSIRASGSVLKASFEQSASPEAVKAAQQTGEIIDQIDALQQTNRRVLRRLSPIGLAELGLEGAVRALIDMLSRNQSEAKVSLDIQAALAGLDETACLTIYRVVQEGLTNALRHAGATTVSVEILSVPRTQSGRDSDAISIAVRDNGEGFLDETQEGFGLKGMRERVSALGGALTIRRLTHGGTRLEAFVPVATRKIDADVSTAVETEPESTRP